MKIFIFNTFYSPNGKGGAEKSVEILANAFTKLGHEVTVLSTSNRFRQDTKNGINLIYFRIRNIYWFNGERKRLKILSFLWHFIDSYLWFNYSRLRKIVINSNPDVIFTNNLLGITDVVWKIGHQLKIPLVHTIRDHFQICYNSTMSNCEINCVKQCSKCYLLNIKKKKHSKYVGAVVGISEYILNRHIDANYFPESWNRSVIPNSILLGRDIKIVNASPVFGFVGSLTRGKGIEFVVDVFVEHFPNTQLLVFGTGEENYENYLVRKSAQSQIQFRGHETNINEIYSRIDCLIVPSLFNEAFGRIVIEAYSFGIPVVASDRGGLPEIVNEETGFIYESNRKDRFVEIVSSIIRNSDLVYKKKIACLNYSKDFDDNSIANKYVSLFEALIKKRASLTSGSLK